MIVVTESDWIWNQNKTFPLCLNTTRPQLPCVTTSNYFFFWQNKRYKVVYHVLYQLWDQVLTHSFTIPGSHCFGKNIEVTASMVSFMLHKHWLIGRWNITSFHVDAAAAEPLQPDTANNYCADTHMPTPQTLLRCYIFFESFLKLKFVAWLQSQ